MATEPTVAETHAAFDRRPIHVRDGGGRRLRHPAPGVEARTAVAPRAARGQPRPGRRRVHRLRRRDASRSRSTSARPPTSRRSSSSARHREGRPRRDRDAQLPGMVDRVLGRGRRRRDRRPAQRLVDRPTSWSTASSDSGAKVVFVDAERLDRLGDVLPGLDVARPSSCRADAGGIARRWEEVMGEVPDDADLARGRPRARRPRDDLLHVGHDRPAEGRARNASQHLRQPHLARRSQLDARQMRAGQASPRRPRGRTCTCCRCRSSTPPAATRSSSPMSRRAASWC